MSFEDHQEKLKQRLLAAPKKERELCFATLLRSMRDEIATIVDEKNLTYKDIQEMLAADGLNVSISTLRRHLGKKRKGKERKSPRQTPSANAEPTLREAVRPVGSPHTATASAGGTAGTGARPIPPMPNPFVPAPGAKYQTSAPDASVPRASSFPVRRDRDQI